MKYSIKPIAFRPDWVEHFGDMQTAVFFQQIYYWSDKGCRADGYVYKTQDEIEYETTLTRKQQDRIRKRLIADGFLEVKKIKANGVPTLHYKITKTANAFVQKGQFRIVPKGQKELEERDKSLTESTNREYTENTNNITTEVVEDNLGAKKIFDILFAINKSMPFHHKTQWQAARWLLENTEKPFELAELAVSVYGQPYAPVITTPLELKNKLSKLESYVRSQRQKQNSRRVVRI